ncbi:ras GTPase [Neohortaea acidophila]|uniref:Ras GTPase n=1 Tax=Neohortaea acidophila TaxID=245834 RepID=A0A6A6PPL3_9PEZI|nr:ras GTPase [Neohortaea acidophila]KAF2481197.1 ras GTPase [Neohortaea acidophila]
MRASTRPRKDGHVRFSSKTDISAPHLDGEDLAKLEKSSTPQFRHLSEMASEEGSEDFGIHSKEEQVVGMAGRKRLQRTGSVKPNAKQQCSFSSQYASTRWMETQRKHLQAYEYLCHIGEARDWIQDVLEPMELPPIVQLEEALRDGVTLAEVVVRLSTGLPVDQQPALGSMRIFRSPRLQFRHSDNIALFFRFLAQVELPELFRFELVDLYEKKNIPKVIYCIHALSWLLYRKGIVEFRIGNLVGQLQFEEHELEETQKGIDRSGVQMPNFGGMKAAMQIEEPEPEPEPTPEELLAEQEDVILDLQSQVRGALVRLRLGSMMQDLWDAEESIARFQAKARGGFAREIFDFRYAMDLSTRRFQAAAKGCLFRRRQQRKQMDWARNQAAVVKVQGLWRGRQDRAQTQQIKTQLQKQSNGTRELQAAIRGALGRWRAGDLWQETHDVEVEKQMALLQAAARGFLLRKSHETRHAQIQRHHDAVTDIQSAARGLAVRLRQARTIGALQGREAGITKLQAVTKASQVRMQQRVLKERLRQQDANVKVMQSFARGMLERGRIGKQFASLEKQESKITDLQSLARAYLERQRIFEQLVEMEKEDDRITQLQALIRAMMVRSNIGTLLAALEDHEDAIVHLQAAARAFVVRSQFETKLQHYHENMQKVIKLQSFVRAKQQGESYKSLVNGKNPPLPVVRRHLHLLTDSTLEFESELEADRLRKQVVESVRRNELVESYVEGLDMKIALLVKNKITLDEVVKHQKHFGGSASQLLRSGAVIPGGSSGLDLKALNKSSRKKLTGYEELFFMLQTQSQYLARLCQQLTARGLAEKDGKNLERLMMTLFGYAQKSREEYFLLKLMAASAQNTISQSQNLEEYLRLQSGAFYQRLLMSYIRSPKDRAYLKSLFGGLVKEGICAQDHLDLESDPLQIYRAILNNEELSTGRQSERPRDLPREVVIREADVRPKYVEHLQDLRDLCDSWFLSLEETLHRMPYGLRYLMAEQYRALCEHFQRDDPAQLAMQMGSWLWKTFLLPALKEPELWGVVDRGLSPAHKRNLGQIITVLSQVAAGRLFSTENLYLQPLNSWMSESLDRWHECLNRVLDVPSLDEHFDADQFSDLYAKTKPTLYIKLADIFALHNLVADNLSAVASARDDPIKELLADLGSAKSNESDLSGAVSGGEITLTLKSRYTVQEDPNADARALFTATKRLVLYVIKVQSGANLMEILLRPISHEDADRWIQLVPSTCSEDRRDLLDLQSMTYAELKSSALENILALEQPRIPAQFRVSRHDNYQELLNALASDIRQKHRRRLDRQREIEGTRATLSQLDAKADFLEDQLKSYNDYIEQCLHTLANKKGAKHKFLLPFTKQWNHERELERAGRQPKFGSYKYSARQLADKGVLLQWPGYPLEQWGQVNVVISSDEVGVFHLEGSSGSLMLPGASANLLLDDLLQAQYDNQNAIVVFEEAGGGAKLAVNLLLHLVFKKFYRDE